jgi:hypothetical protein
MDERLKFIARLLDGDKMAGLCRELGVSRKTGIGRGRSGTVGCGLTFTRWVLAVVIATPRAAVVSLRLRPASRLSMRRVSAGVRKKAVATACALSVKRWAVLPIEKVTSLHVSSPGENNAQRVRFGNVPSV